jgi:ferrous iron transport protein B
MNREIKTFLLAGNPNCGKTSLFNLLAGLNQKVSNIPGTTVEKVVGKLNLPKKGTCKIIDLPGAYSLFPKSEDELVASEELLNAQNAVVVFVADSTRLESNLFYFSQILDLGLPTVLVLNMVDLAAQKGILIDIEKLSEAFGVLVVNTSARNADGIAQLKSALDKTNIAHQKSFFKKNENFNSFREYNEKQIDHFKIHGNLFSEGRKEDSENRQLTIREILGTCVSKQSQKKGFAEKLDNYLLHPIWGLVIMFCILFLVFQSVFSLAELPMQGIELLFSESGSLLNKLLPDGFFKDLLVGGIISGLAGIVVFLPQILILFFFIGIMEETGYITRVSFLTDRFMRRFGINGKSVIPLTGGLACAIPSIMAARSIENKAEKLATILITPLMTCSARLPVYTLIISLMIPEDSYVGFFNARGIVLMGMYLLGFISALLFSLIFRLFINSEIKDFFLLEVPELKSPRWKALFVTLYRKAMTFLMGAGKVILIVSLILFFLKSFGPSDSMHKVREKYKVAENSTLSQTEESQMKSELLQASYAGQIGKIIEPAIRPMGFDWKIGIALITSFAAREVFVGTMSAIYGVADDEEGLGLREKLRQERHPDTGKPVYNFAVLFSLLIFYAYALQCMSTLAVVYKETNSIKWPLVQLLSMTGTAYLLSTLVYSIFS